MKTKKTILVIDDEKDLVNVLKFRFEKEGYNVLVAYNGADGLKVLETNEPDLIVLDVAMPVMDGLEFYRRISDKDAISKYPVLVLTARGEMKDLFKDINAAGFMAKPFEIDELYKEMVIILKEKDTSAKKVKKITPSAKKVLIIDDNDEDRNRITIAFLGAGYSVRIADTGMATLEKIVEDIPDLLVIRLGLKDITGDTVIYKLKKMPRTADLPVVLYSSEMTKTDYEMEKNIAKNLNVGKIITTSDPYYLLEAAKEALQENN